MPESIVVSRTRLLFIDGPGGSPRAGGHVAPDLTVRLHQGFAKRFDLTLGVLGPVADDRHRPLPSDCRAVYLPSYSSKWEYASVRRAMRRILSSEIASADLVVARIPSFHGADALAAAAHRVPSVCLVVGTWEETIGRTGLIARLAYPRVARRVTRSAARHADLVLAQGRPLAAYLAALGVSAIPVIESPLEPSDFLPSPTAGTTPIPGRFEVLTIGRLVPSKNVASLVDAVGLLRGGGVDAELTVAGDGDLRAALEARAAGRRVPVTWAGAVEDRATIRSMLASADVFALPSRSEGVPLAVLEAMAAGLPVVAAPVGGLTEILTDGEDALLVDEPTPDRLAGALARLAGDRDLARRLGERGRAAAAGLTHDAWVERFHELVDARLGTAVGAGRE